MKEYLTLKEAIELLAIGYLTDESNCPPDYLQRMKQSTSFFMNCLQKAFTSKAHGENASLTAYGKPRTLHKKYLKKELSRLPAYPLLERYGHYGDDREIDISEMRKLNEEALEIECLYTDINFIHVKLPFDTGLPEGSVFGYGEVRILKKDFLAAFPQIRLVNDASQNNGKNKNSDLICSENSSEAKKAVFREMGRKGGKAKKAQELLKKYIEDFAKSHQSATYEEAWRIWKNQKTVTFEGTEINFTETKVEIDGKTLKKPSVSRYFYDAKKVLQ